MDIRKEEFLKVIEKYPNVISLEEQNYRLILKIKGIRYRGEYVRRKAGKATG